MAGRGKDDFVDGAIQGTIWGSVVGIIFGIGVCFILGPLVKSTPAA